MNQHTSSGASLSHQAHEKHLDDLAHEAEQRLFHIKNQDCAQYQLVLQALLQIHPLLYEKNKWLTIGDYNGLEANFLENQGQDVLASDISDTFLKAAHQAGLIQQYRKLNVEKIEASDNAFDYVFCKEAYHHFPRAFLGLYEMIRVAKKAVILIEPIDILAKMPVMLFTKNILDRFDPLLINKLWKNRFSFEEVGNYVFKISEREVEKIAMGIGLPCIAFKGVNFPTGDGQDSRMQEIPTNQTLMKETAKKIRVKNTLSKLGLVPYNHLYSIIFKELPSNQTVKTLQKEGYKVLMLPENPYL